MNQQVHIQPADRAALRELRPWLASRANRVLPTRKVKLDALLPDACLLLARSAGRARDPNAGKLLGLAGLGLDSGRVELLVLAANIALPGLLQAVEQRAVSFGMQELTLQLAPSKSRAPELPQWRSPAGLPGYRLRRLGRRLTAEARKAAALCRELGIPADYGCRHRLRLQHEPAVLASIGEDVFGREQFMLPAAATALHRMVQVAGENGVVIQAVSAFRSVDYQADLLRKKLARGLDMAGILQVSAAPGYSEHHSGRAVDLTAPGYPPLEEKFERSPAFAWLELNARRFGFHLSYPRNNRHAVSYEPWHWYFSG